MHTVFVTHDPPWWDSERERLLALMETRSDAFVYHLPTVRARYRALADGTGVDRVLYAMKANPHPAILSVIEEEGGSFECVSPGEIHHLLEHFPGLDRARILFTPNFAPREDYAFALAQGIETTLDALHPLEHWASLLAEHAVVLRIDPGWGSGHHEKVVTGGVRSKFGISREELSRASELAGPAGIRIAGLHLHAGSGITDEAHWGAALTLLRSLTGSFSGIRSLNVGGGLAVVTQGRPAPDPEAVGRWIREARAGMPAGIEVRMEPGRYLVADAGVLLARVTQMKGKGGGEARYIGVATGMNSLIRPTLYGAHHRIVNLTRLDAPVVGRFQVVGPICETGDHLGVDVPLPETREGDVLLVEQAGAYGRSMASHYNLRAPAPEFMIP